VMRRDDESWTTRIMTAEVTTRRNSRPGTADERMGSNKTWSVSDGREKILVIETSGEAGSLWLTPPLRGIDSISKGI